MMVNNVQQSGFNQLGFHNGGHNFDQWFSGENNRAFWNRVNIAGKFKVEEVIQEIFLEHAGGPQVVHIFLIKVKIFNILDDLL